MYVLLAFNSFVLIMCGHLISFHIWLYYQGISTFDWIFYSREKKEKDRQLKVINTFIFSRLQIGEIDLDEYREWFIYQTPKSLKKRSKIIQEISKKKILEDPKQKDTSSFDPHLRREDSCEDKKNSDSHYLSAKQDASTKRKTFNYD